MPAAEVPVASYPDLCREAALSFIKMMLGEFRGSSTKYVFSAHAPDASVDMLLQKFGKQSLRNRSAELTSSLLGRSTQGDKLWFSILQLFVDRRLLS